MQYALNALVMGYRPLWSSDRQLSGVQLFLHDSPDEPVDVAHLLRILRETWSPTAPRLLLSPQSSNNARAAARSPHSSCSSAPRPTSPSR